MNAILQSAPPAHLHPDEWQGRLPARVSGGTTGGGAEARHFLISPFGLHYSEVTASNLVKIDLQGRVLDGASHPVNLRSLGMNDQGYRPP